MKDKVKEPISGTTVLINAHLDHMVTSCIQYSISVGVLSHCLFPQTSGNNQEQWYDHKQVHLLDCTLVKANE